MRITKSLRALALATIVPLSACAAIDDDEILQKTVTTPITETPIQITPPAAYRPFNPATDAYPKQLFMQGQKDESGVPMLRSTSDVPQAGLALRVQSDRDFCRDIDQLRFYSQLNDVLLQREAEIEKLEDQLRAATDALEKRILERQIWNKRFFIADTVLSVIQIGLGLGIKAPSEYLGLVAAGGVQNGLRGLNSDQMNRVFIQALKVQNAWMQDYGKRMEQFGIAIRVANGFYSFYYSAVLNGCVNNGHLPETQRFRPVGQPVNPGSGPAQAPPAQPANPPVREEILPPARTRPSSAPVSPPPQNGNRGGPHFEYMS